MNDEQVKDIVVKSVADALSYRHPSKKALTFKERMLVASRNAVNRTILALEGKLSQDTLASYVTLEEDINKIFNKRNISIEFIKVAGDLYTIKVNRKGDIK